MERSLVHDNDVHEMDDQPVNAANEISDLASVATETEGGTSPAIAGAPVPVKAVGDEPNAGLEEELSSSLADSSTSASHQLGSSVSSTESDSNTVEDESTTTDGDEIMNKIVEHIKEAVVQTDPAKLGVGHEVRIEYFDDDIAKAKSKNPNKPVGYTQLCERDDLPIDARTLGNWVRAAAQQKDLQNKKLDSSSFSMSIYLTLASVAESRRDELAKEAKENHYTVRQLRKRIEETKPTLKGKTNPIPQKLSRGLKAKSSMILDSTVQDFINDQEAVKTSCEDSKALTILKEVNRKLTELTQEQALLAKLRTQLVEIVEQSIEDDTSQGSKADADPQENADHNTETADDPLN